MEIAALNLHQKELAEELGVTTGTWQNWESGKFPPSSEALERLAALGIDGHWLLSGEGEVLQSQRMATGARNAESDLLQLGLTPRMLELADKGTRADLFELIRVLLRAKEIGSGVLTFDQIISRLREEGAVREAIEVEADLQLLCSTGQIAVIDGPDGREYQVNSPVELAVETLPDQLQLLRECIYLIGRQVFPVSRRLEHQGWLAHVEVKLPAGDGPNVLAEFRQTVVSSIAKYDELGPDSLKLVIGAVVDPSKSEQPSSRSTRDNNEC